MKIGLVMDEDHNLTPLDQGPILAIIDEEKKLVETYENPGYGVPHGGKEMAMEAMLTLDAEAVVVKKGFLCPGSYSMSYGRLKYLPTDHQKLEELLNDLEKVKKEALEELDPEMYDEMYPE